MQFIRTSDRAHSAAALRTRLATELDTGRVVLWLLSGGSNIEISVAVADALTDEQTTNLIIMLADERHGPVGHAQSNGTKLLAAGFNHKRAQLIPVLVGDRDLETTRESFEQDAIAAFAKADIVIGQLGIGPDGHIAGILPESRATASAQFVSAYMADDFDRLTLTSRALKRINVCYVSVFGADKRAALSKLERETVAYAEQPSQILKELPEVYIFNDQIGDES